MVSQGQLDKRMDIKYEIDFRCILFNQLHWHASITDSLHHVCLSKVAVACVGFQSKIKAQILISKYAHVQKNVLKGEW